MDTLRAITYFARALELGSLSAVAREAGTTQPTISKALAGLERQLGVRLLERSTTSLVATVPGQRFYGRARRLLEEYTEAVADARGQTGQPAGLLRVHAAVAFGQLRLNGLVQRFLDQHPAIQIELILDDRYVDLVEDGVDVALRLGDGSGLPPDAVARLLATSSRTLVAAPAYLARRADLPLAVPADLAGHDYLRYAWLASGDLLTLWSATARAEVRTHGRFRVNHALAIRDTLLLGGGVGLCPAWLVHDLVAEGRLKSVLPDWHGVPQQLHLLLPSRHYPSVRARLFADFISAEVPRLPGFAAATAPPPPA